MPVTLFPKWVQHISEWTPIYHINQLVVNFAKKGEFSWKSLIFILVYATIATGLALLSNRTEKVTMFRTYQKNDFAYFVSLIFLVFPILGVFGGYYPVWTLVLTGLFTIAYLLIVYLKKLIVKWIPFLWFYTLAYIIFMSISLPRWHDVVCFFQC